jgi:hypothetical protein
VFFSSPSVFPVNSHWTLVGEMQRIAGALWLVLGSYPKQMPSHLQEINWKSFFVCLIGASLVHVGLFEPPQSRCRRTSRNKLLFHITALRLRSHHHVLGLFFFCQFTGFHEQLRRLGSERFSNAWKGIPKRTIGAKHAELVKMPLN